jgi:hypothetical protein
MRRWLVVVLPLALLWGRTEKEEVPYELYFGACERQL